MCCFAEPVSSVAGTNIFAAMRSARSAAGACVQILVYEASVSTESSNAMVLPIPVRLDVGATGIRLLDLSGVPDFFKDLFGLFPMLWAPFGAPSFGAPPPPPQLEVHRVGAYEVSIVPTINDFGRLSSLFRLGSPAPPNKLSSGPRGLLPVFQQRYADHSFIVCQLASGKTDLHPFGLTFISRYPQHLFFPTLHVHDGALHENAHFDHYIYGQGCRLQERSESLSSLATGGILLRKLPFLYPHLPVERTVLQGIYTNTDIYCPIADPISEM